MKTTTLLRAGADKAGARIASTNPIHSAAFATFRATMTGGTSTYRNARNCSNVVTPKMPSFVVGVVIAVDPL